MNDELADCQLLWNEYLYTTAGVTIVRKKDEQSAEPCLVVNAEASTMSELDAGTDH